ncbi:Hsp20/alpha crystallin family protein [Psychroserpens sp.]|uniref:Hsp20/alpha crystallin family protein n=1 Tax=Psychroserpens sp. TaxID=2020870 RepID=UPI001B29063B|nr:Hsp20/alpha crystallin family protein [Psychroserpens sp.]MBO6607506.1 Hsp20/alpha crystallin family protein [Psychroserpens sp.]MBO6654416.1 Hsp20/alpha crystallin family protein [Psychroserpens sp.]MBO6681235.1 Hsp20/alpha crystallin family protein [Psychroserpens sp.]MBO6749808.1 Hsp20/alpha crystallin family protein [Psychroserpens sp.]MBO6916204.1 Hsp20/alpha crystallin family protein [Psychroserpens sp.]
MSLIKFNKRNRFFPWTNEGLKSFLSDDAFFTHNFLEEDSLMPAMNVKEHDMDYEIEFAAPGFSKEDFEVTIDDNILNVTGEKKKELEEKEEEFTRREFSYSSFKRSLALPKSVNMDQDVKATYKDGILKLKLQKKEDFKEQSKRVIEIL